jgi:hypothetical protein
MSAEDSKKDHRRVGREGNNKHFLATVGCTLLLGDIARKLVFVTSDELI